MYHPPCWGHFQHGHILWHKDDSQLSQRLKGWPRQGRGSQADDTDHKKKNAEGQLNTRDVSNRVLEFLLLPHQLGAATTHRLAPISPHHLSLGTLTSPPYSLPEKAGLFFSGPCAFYTGPHQFVPLQMGTHGSNRAILIITRRFRCPARVEAVKTEPSGHEKDDPQDG